MQSLLTLAASLSILLGSNGGGQQPQESLQCIYCIKEPNLDFEGPYLEAPRVG